MDGRIVEDAFTTRWSSDYVRGAVAVRDVGEEHQLGSERLIA
jgi:hypothetical protein